MGVLWVKRVGKSGSIGYWGSEHLGRFLHIWSASAVIHMGYIIYAYTLYGCTLSFMDTMECIEYRVITFVPI
jgi:hypothetical protein